MLRRFFNGLLCVALALSSSASAHAQNPAVTINVDANVNRHPINPNVYGLAYASTAQLLDLNCPLNRYGGNNASRYNWLLNADNRANDWYYESIGDPSAVAGERGDTFITQTRAGNAEPMLTIPMIGWVAKLGSNRSKLSGFSIAKYGAQSGSDSMYFPDAGNGVKPNLQVVTGNDPLDANVAADSVFQQGWVQHLVTRWGSAQTGGLRYYVLDNEHSIWQGTHRDVHPTGANMEEIRDRMADYAAKIKAIDSSALVVGPEEWGWSGYFYSGYDQQWGGLHGWNNLPDRAAHGNMDYLPWLLDQLRQRSTASGTRLLDVFTVHYYPQNGEFGNDVSTNMQQLRNRSTRALWDPNYVNESWINDRVNLIPRIRAWVNTYYPGTKVGLTEYNWGAEGHINGATTQADILGIFGRENLDVAARWTTPDTATPTYKSIKIYRNYDGNRSTFGDVSVAATAPNPDNVSAFAAQRSSDGALTVMVINKYLANNTPATINLANFSHNGVAQVWQLSAANNIAHLADIGISGSTVSITLPQQTITLLVIPQASVLSSPGQLSASAANGTASLNWSDNNTIEEGFYVERARFGQNFYRRVGQVAANTVSFQEALPHGMYLYRVQAFNLTTGQVSGYSNWVRVRVP